MAKRRLTLNLRGFQVFEAVARHLSVTQAANELGITQSAVSHQLRQLADILGEELIERQGRSIGLTQAGAKLAEDLDTAFDLIEQAAATTIGLPRRMVRVAMYPSFAKGWIVPELSDFIARHPEIDLRMVLMSDPPEISDRLADVFITSELPRRGYWSSTLCAEMLVPVAHPRLPADWEGGMPLITSETDPSLAGTDWEAFATYNGLALREIQRGPWQCCSHFLLALEMAQAAMGAALIPDFLAAPALASGAVRRLPGRSVPTGLGYDVQVKYKRRTEPDIRTFTSWLRRVARLHSHEFDL